MFWGGVGVVYKLAGKHGIACFYQVVGWSVISFFLTVRS